MAIYIGIDPGVNTGISVWDTKERKFLAVRTSRILDAIYLCQEILRREVPHIIFEDARKRQWLPRERNLSEYRGKLMGAGSVKRDCEIWEEFCQGYNIPYTALPPRQGLTKWTPEYFARVTGWNGRTSNHARDAAMLVFQR